MKKITVFQASDGQQFATKGEATAHETQLAIEVEMRDLADPVRRAVGGSAVDRIIANLMGDPLPWIALLQRQARTLRKKEDVAVAVA